MKWIFVLMLMVSSSARAQVETEVCQEIGWTNQGIIEALLTHESDEMTNVISLDIFPAHSLIMYRQEEMSETQAYFYRTCGASEIKFIRPADRVSSYHCKVKWEQSDVLSALEGYVQEDTLILPARNCQVGDPEHGKALVCSFPEYEHKIFFHPGSVLEAQLKLVQPRENQTQWPSEEEQDQYHWQDNQEQCGTDIEQRNSERGISWHDLECKLI